MIAINKIIFVILLCCSASSFACNAQSTVWNDILECYMESERKTETNFNEAYQKTLKQLPVQKKITLKKSQRQWLQQMESDCAKLTNQEQYGREGVFEAIQCRINEMEKRTIFFEQYQ